MVLATSSSCGADVCDASTGTLCIISFPTPWLSELKSNYDSDPKLKVILQVVQLGSNSSQGFTFYNGLLFYKGRLYLSDSNQDLKAVVLQQVHDSPLGGHSGYLKTLHRLQKDFIWPSLR